MARRRDSAQIPSATQRPRLTWALSLSLSLSLSSLRHTASESPSFLHQSDPQALTTPTAQVLRGPPLPAPAPSVCLGLDVFRNNRLHPSTIRLNGRYIVTLPRTGSGRRNCRIRFSSEHHFGGLGDVGRRVLGTEGDAFSDRNGRAWSFVGSLRRGRSVSGRGDLFMSGYYD